MTRLTKKVFTPFLLDRILSKNVGVECRLKTGQHGKEKRETFFAKYQRNLICKREIIHRVVVVFPISAFIAKKLAPFPLSPPV
jgi:hypothetical protein